MKSDIRTHLLKFVSDWRSIGSIAPSSSNLGNAIAQQCAGLEACQIVELGSGSGAISRYLLDRSPILVEQDVDFCALLRRRYPAANVQHDSAENCLTNLRERCGIVFTIPTINNPAVESLLALLTRKYQSGDLAWVVAFTYGFGDPLQGMRFQSSQMRQTVWRNMPPARVWVYQ